MPEYTVRLATKAEVKEIADWFMQERSKDPRFASFTKSAIRRLLYQKVVTPRYLRSQANTFVLEQDGRTAGFAVVEQGGDSVTLADFSLREGADEQPLLKALLARTEQLARDRDYPYVRIAPLETNDARLAFFHQAGYELADYYLWSFVGEVAGIEPPDGVLLQPLAAKQALERRIHFLRREMDASHVSGRKMIEASLLPRRPPAFRSFSIELAEAPGPDQATEIGYLSPRPNERHDGVLTVAISLDSAYWGTELEAQIVGGMASEIGRGKPQPVRTLISTTAHADRAEEAFARIGLQREMDYRPILYRDLSAGQVAQTSP